MYLPVSTPVRLIQTAIKLLYRHGYEDDAESLALGQNPELVELLLSDEGPDFLCFVADTPVPACFDPDAPIPYTLTRKAKAVEITAEGIRVG